MASKYLITKNVLKEYDDWVIEQRATENTTDPAPLRDWIATKLRVVKTKETKLQNSKLKFLEFVFLTEQEYWNLITGYGTNKVKDIIQRLNDYIGSKGDSYKSHYHTILTWFNKKGIQPITAHKELPPKSEQIKAKEFVPMTDEQKKEAFEKLLAFKKKLWTS